MDLAGKKLLFNGVLSYNGVRHYVQDVPVKSYSIDGYGAVDDPNATVYILSPQASREREYDVWYRLRSPSRQYKCYQEAFQWVATLGKHVIDYLDDQRNVGLADFRQKFNAWLQHRFPNNPDFHVWREAYGSFDFRKTVHAHISYLWSEAVCLQGKTLLKEHPLWDECGRSDHEMIKPECAKVVATPWVYKCFKNRYFASQLAKMELSDAIRAARESRTEALGLPSELQPSPSLEKASYRHRDSDFKIGDVVSIAPDEYENQMWRKTAQDSTGAHEWLGYIQHTKPTEDGQLRLYVIWLYRPEDTPILTTDYPVKNELFISDNCNCQEFALMSTDVTRRCSVEWFSKSFDTSKDFLVRQKYDTKTESFVTMSETDFRCTCQGLHPSSSSVATYRQGETVYLNRSDRLDPVVVEQIDPVAKMLKVRRLVRLSKIPMGAVRNMPQRFISTNELAWTEDFQIVPYKNIQGRCDVRFFSREDIISSRVQFPYNQGGAGHCWVLSMRLVALDGHSVEELIASPHNLRQGPGYTSSDSTRALPGLSLFSGLGNLDRGLEEAGAVHFHTSVDMNGRAIQTLRANAEDSKQLKLWFGSVDDYLHALLSGNSPHMKLVAEIGQVCVIAAGSPCPGFSKLQQDWRSEQSLKNAAHVTTFASFVDVYRPEYGFLENVVNIGAQRKEAPEELVLSQLIACLVSMGYQVKQFIMSSWRYGSPQHRNRTILAIAAPGRTPIAEPRPTHGDPEGHKLKSVGKLMNGERFGVQVTQPTPFAHTTAEDALKHLPNIGCGLKYPCIRFPDHVLRLRPNIKERRCLSHIPTNPPGVGLEYAVRHELIPRYLYETKSEISGKSYKRIKKDGLIGTIVTAPSPHDSRSGPFVHYNQNRCITLEEARIGQNIPHEEVLIGSVNDQYKMVGNAVDRRVSKALGLELRRAVDQDLHRSPVIKNRSLSVVINGERQSSLIAHKPFTKKHDGESFPTLIPPDIDEELDMGSDDLNDIQAYNHLEASFSRHISRKEASQSTERKSSVSSESDSIPAGNIEETAQDQARLEAQLEDEYGFLLQVKPGRSFIHDEEFVDYDVPRSGPTLAMSGSGFLGRLPDTLSATPSSPRSPSINQASYPIPNRALSDSSESVMRTKRSRDEEIAGSDRSSRGSSRGTFDPSKRIKERQDESSRKTRHSGLSIEFAPKNWSKTVETDLREKPTATEPQPRSYA